MGKVWTGELVVQDANCLRLCKMCKIASNSFFFLRERERKSEIFMSSSKTTNYPTTILP